MKKYFTILIVFFSMIGFNSAYSAGEHIAFFAASSQNGFNQAVYEGVEAKAKEMGATSKMFNGEFNAVVQAQQIEDAIASKEFDGFVVLPNDSVGIANFVQEAIDAGIPTATTLFPIGPDLTSIKPQVKGITATVIHPVIEGATWQADAVVDEGCKGIDPCNVIIIIGQKIYPFDNLRLETFRKVLSAHSNIKVVSEVMGNYDPDTALAGVQDALQANAGTQIHVILSNADQHLVGADIALEDAGYVVEDLFLMGGGASAIGLDMVRAGRWDYTKGDFPYSLGTYGTEAVIKHIRGEPYESEINMDERGPVPGLINKAVLDKFPDFKGEWKG
jgi:ribose transport system substrate-binding protein|tara:strand:- start:1773 stop:2768 length:996 start_codon:yes stop_codon:yes gene_type:complete